MKTLGFDQPLYILPFDHRGSFQTTAHVASGVESCNLRQIRVSSKVSRNHPIAHAEGLIMIVFPLQALMAEQACYDYLLSVLHPQGLHCPQGHPLPAAQGAHDRHRAPIVDYRCKTCGAVFNLFTNAIWSKTRYSCATIVLILRGIAQGVPTAHLAGELGIDRTHLLEHRHKIQRLIEQRFPPDHPEGRRDRSR